MSANRNRLAQLFDILGSAVAAAAAEDRGQAPRARDLRNLGIDPATYRNIRRS